jgi:hypothetical protein
VGLKQQVSPENVPKVKEFLKKIAAEINLRFARTEIG